MSGRGKKAGLRCRENVRRDCLFSLPKIRGKQKVQNEDAPKEEKKLLNIILTEAINTIKITNKQWRSERRKNKTSIYKPN